jgi:hypothetical protein
MSFSGFLGRSLELLDAEMPTAHRSVAKALGTRTVNLEVDGERLAIFAVRSRITLSPAVYSATALAKTTRRALRRLLQGEQGLTESILIDEVMLQGPVEDLAALYDVLLSYFRGAVRSPGFPPLLDEFLAEGERE